MGALSGQFSEIKQEARRKLTGDSLGPRAGTNEAEAGVVGEETDRTQSKHSNTFSSHYRPLL